MPKKNATPAAQAPRKIVDSTLPRTPVTIGGKTYDLCLDLGALSEAETELVRKGHDVNILMSLPPVNLTATRIIFGAAMRRFHPEISYEQAVAMLTPKYIHGAYIAIVEAWNKSVSEPDEAGETKNPTEPGS